MIPHTIHYCWFGHNRKPKLIKKCIKSWEKYFPDWNIVEWNENNYDVNKNKYISEAYQKKKWAFVVDYARFDILYHYGGVFLDTDVEFLKTISNDILQYKAFTGFETSATVNPGLIFASEQNHPMLHQIMDVYEHKTYGAKIDGRIENIVDIVTGVLKENGLREDNTFQIVNDVAIFPQDFFCCFNHEIQAFEITDNTVSIHHYFASWSPWYRKLYFRSIKVVAKILGKKRYLGMKKKIISTIRK